MKNNLKNPSKSTSKLRIGLITLAAILLLAVAGFVYLKFFRTDNLTSSGQSSGTSNPIDGSNGSEHGNNGTPVPNTVNQDLLSPPSNSMAFFLSQNNSKYLDPKLGPTGREIIEPVTGEVGTWDIPIPLINPLGSQKLYTGGTRYDADDGRNIQYISNYTEYEKSLSGECWILSLNEGSGLPIKFLKNYAQQIGATIFSSTYADRLIFSLKQPDAIWWCDARETYYGYEIAVVKQKLYEVGKEYTITGDTLAKMNDKVAFSTENTGEKFQTIRIGLPSGKIRIYARNEKFNGNSASRYRYDITLDSKISKTFILDNLPQEAGLFDWEFAPWSNDMPSGLTFKLEESYDLPKVKEGNEPGSLLVKGAPFGSITVQPQNFVLIDYREGNQRDLYGERQDIEGSLTPEGETLFILPPGLWTVVNRAPYMNNGSTQTQLVPVSSGEQTIVTLPESLKSANARLNSMADDSELTGSIEIAEAKDLTTTAEISLSVSDPLDRDINPTKESTTIYEGSTLVEITDIRRVVAPCSIALVIDSSGSMKNDMTSTLEAAKNFLKTLPEGSYVKVIDFDTQVRVLKGETPADAIKALSGITSGGYTKLYDATLKGVETIAGKTRPAVVVFTDGRDSSLDKTGGGSVNSKSTVTEKIKASKIPVYTIGFGKRLNEEQKANSSVLVDGAPDIQCLLEFASTSGGQYYPAKDPAALPGVFAAISSKLGNNFVITYNRPTEHNISETPFISMVVDNSGSMNTDPSVGKDCNYRMEKTISLFHDFIAKLPDKAMMQFTTFQTPPMSPPLIIQHQTTTDQKANFLKSLGNMNARGGTPVVEALRTAYENILPVPSSRKIIVFLTDGGLAVEPEQLGQYNDLLADIKEKNITILFIGMGAHSKEELFSDAAKASGGDYVISEDIDDIQAKLDQLLSILKETTPPKTIPLSVSLEWDTVEGEELNYSVADEVAFSLSQKAGPAIEPDMVKISTGQPYHRYNTIASTATGLGIPGTDNIITGSVTFNKKLSNNAMELTAKQGIYLSKFQGVDAERGGKQFVALEVELENKTANKISYEIPSLFKHFYIGVNEEGLYPASKATWLTGIPLAPYGNPQVTVNPGEKKTGSIVFVIPNSQGISQLSLHFYDTNYGHIQLPLTGKMSDRWLEIEKLPASSPTSLSDTFTMQVTGTSLKAKIDKYPAVDLSSFRVVEAQFESKVQALLNLDPKDRMWLKVNTKSGSLMSRMSDVTAALPFGFLEPVMLGPGSDNTVRMAFDLPWKLDKYQSSVYVDLARGYADVPVNSGEIYGAPKPVLSQDGPGISITINQLVALADGIKFPLPNGNTSTGFNNSVILDVTITDLPGNEGTKIPTDFFSLVSKDYEAPSGGVTTGRIGFGGASNNNLFTPDRKTEQLIYGVDSTFGVFEGQSRRGIIIFQKPRDSVANWTLQSPYMEGLQVPISSESFTSPELLSYKTEVAVTKEFEDQLDAAVTASINRHASQKAETSSVVQIGLNETDGRQNVPMPSLSTYGLKQLEQITNEAQVIRMLQSLRCLPVNRDGGYLLSFGYQPEGVLSQGWGEIGDMTNLALRLFSRLGFAPEVRALKLTKAGENALLDFSGVNVVSERTIPLGISYRNATGEHKMLVIPFMMDLSELEGYVYYQTDNMDGYTGYNPHKAVIKVSVRYMPGAENGSASGTAGDIGSSLGGSEGGETYDEILMLETEIPIADLSADALDLCFMQNSSSNNSNNYYALLSGPNGLITGQAILENPSQVLGVQVEISRISGIGKPLVHYSTLGDGDTLSNFFQTIAINLPDLTEEAANVLDEQARRVHDAAKNPDPISIARWYGRNTLYQFISGNSMFDNQMVGEMGLVLGRVNQPRCLILTSHLDKAGTMHTTLDLLQPWNQIHAGKEDAINAYNLMAGFYLSTLEAQVLPGSNKIGYLDLWTQAPAGTAIQAIPCLESNRDEILHQMEVEDKYPTLLLEAVKENQKLILVPTEPTVFQGQKRWAWLEIDPETYKTLSVFDTGLHAGMAEFKLSLLPSEDDTIKWMKGVWVGTNVSVWTMCSSSLKYGDDYKAVLSDAKKTAMEVVKVVSEFFELSESIKDMEIGFDIDLGNSHKIEFKIGMSGIKGSLAQKMYSLSGGMKLAIDAYFKSIAPPPPSPPSSQKK